MLLSKIINVRALGLIPGVFLRVKSGAMNFYKSYAWRHKRERVLRRDGYLCCECRRYGRSTAATTVHHIEPLKDKPGLRLEGSNLISLCNKCHERMHDRDTNTLTPLGVEWVRRK